MLSFDITFHNQKRGQTMGKKDLSVKKSNYLNQASYKLSVVEQKLIAMLVAQIKNDATDFKPYSLNIKDFCSLIGVESSNYSYIVSVAKSLLDRDVHFWYVNDKGKNIEVITKWLSSCVHTEGSGTVEMNFDNVLKPFLLQLRNRFTLYRLENILQLTSVFSIRIYELLKQYENIGSVFFTLEDLRKYIGIDDTQYKMYADFKRRVLVIAQKEIKSKCDIYFDYDEIKVGRSIGKILFYIKPQAIPPKNVTITVKQSKPAKPVNPDLEELIQLLPEKYQKLASFRKMLSKALEETNKNYVVRNIIYSNDKSNDINYRAYLGKSLKYDYGLAYQEDQELKKEEADRQKQTAIREAKQKELEYVQIQREKENRTKAREMIAKLSEEEKSAMQAEVISQLKSPFKERYDKNHNDPIAAVQIRLNMENIIMQRHPEDFK